MSHGDQGDGQAVPRIPAASRMVYRRPALPHLPPVRQPQPPADRRPGISSEEAELVKWIKDQSGLTWDQIARAFDVSRRAVHLWANGGRVSAGNAEAIQSFAALVRRANAATPEEARTLLLSVGSDGMSPLDRFRRYQYEASVTVTGTPLTPAVLLSRRR